MQSFNPRPRIHQGRVLEADVPDPRGLNRKRRPLVVTTPTEDLRDGEPFAVVCISTKIHEYPSQYNVFISGPKAGIKLPTGLTEDSVAVCEWQLLISENDICALLGYLKPKDLDQILDNLEKLKEK